MPSFNQRDAKNPHFQLPFRPGGVNGGAFVNEQDTYEDIVQCIKTLIAYPIGSNPYVPDFGTPEIVFKQIGSIEGIPDMLKTAILQWESRAAMEFQGVPFTDDTLLFEIIDRVGVTDG